MANRKLPPEDVEAYEEAANGLYDLPRESELEQFAVCVAVEALRIAAHGLGGEVTEQQVMQLLTRAYEQLRQVRRGRQLRLLALRCIDVHHHELGTAEAWGLCDSIDWVMHGHLPMDVYSRVAAEELGVETRTWQIMTDRTVRPLRGPEAWPTATTSLAAGALRMWGTAARGKWDTVNNFLHCFGLHVEPASPAERARWTPQQRTKWNHPLAHDWKEAKKLRCSPSTLPIDLWRLGQDRDRAPKKEPG